MKRSALGYACRTSDDRREQQKQIDFAKLETGRSKTRYS